ncbi:hypothetical protein [Tropicimonas isoalkanivorans]|uniref:Glutamine amidotransferase n=1 Tax=Tropicimonas isoalkanivorans TaxID=441112 RepID=A0A1I1IKL1_9RHOB|nr:hypothetical protein [Tropicimonas isoalkanivorans]SFC36725.1 hypothetical protein SAMN04488094_104128 [Tropicimonas isoalkanivorans]
MSGGSQILFDPLLPWVAVWVAAALAVALVALAVWRGLRGWWLRALAVLALLVAIANPSWQEEDRDPLSDIVLLVVDRTASQGMSDRADQTDAAVDRITAAVEALPDTELRTVTLRDAADNAGTLAMAALAEMMAEEPRGRIAGAILVSDGIVHDIEHAPDLPAPLHLLMTGRETDWDRRLLVKSAPTFAIVGEEVVLTLRIEDDGAVPEEVASGRARIEIAIDGGEPMPFDVPVGRDLELPLTLPHGGMNVVQIEVAGAEGELTDRNNAAVVQINGVRDRLRVLLVSGEPHAGERTWRNLLKSDSAVDLVHFTILRPPEKQDGVPVTELSLIAFPTRELFLEKVDEFDLIVFDRYRRRGILPMIYLDNVVSYVERGGAVLMAAGPEFAAADSLYRSPLSEILPAAPSARVIEQGYTPRVTDVGHKHPVTEGLEALAPPPADGEDGPGWGRWFRLTDVVPERGQVVMSGPEERPLLVLDRVGEGRVALLASDHAWLWSRGFEGGGPQLELLRRLAHWMMKEPELEEEALTATAEGLEVTIVRRTLGDAPEPVDVTAPDGSVVTVPLEEESPGRFVGTFTGGETGLYRLAEGDLTAVVALGPAAPREFEETIATDDILADSIAAHGGGAMEIEDGLPTLRQVREGRTAAGRGWIGITPRGAYRTADVTVIPLVAPLLFLLMAIALTVGAWLHEGRR